MNKDEKKGDEVAANAIAQKPTCDSPKSGAMTSGTASVAPTSPTPPKHMPSPRKPAVSISSAAASTLVLSTSPGVGVATGAAVGRAAKKKVVELECGEVRWFYKRHGESKWSAFKGYDSMSLEIAYRAVHQVPMDVKTSKLLTTVELQSDNVTVMDSLFEWNPNETPEIIRSIYWKGETIKVRRGTWFYADSMQPIDPELADAIEKHHLENFRNQVIPDSPVFSEYEANKKPVLTSLKWQEHEEVRWNSVIDILLYNNTKANRFMRIVTRGKGVYPLKRGFSSEADFDDGQPIFSDLILVVHGIGQKGYENLIAKNTTMIRDAVETLMDKYYTNEKRRPMILPIEWRSSLVLDGSLTETITLPRMPSVRNTLNSIAMDIMYYQSPLYRTEIINGVIHCMNTTYSVFMKNNPSFTGPVSILAHSLGSVIAYDILTNWSPLLLYDEYIKNAIESRRDDASDDEQRELFENFHECRKKLLEDEGHLRDILLRRDEELQFKVKNLFCLGSPLGVFVAMRGAHFSNIVPVPAQCERLYNIFHPYDIVAYRLEPMFHENYRHIRPVKLFSYNETNRDYNVLGYEVHKSYLKKKKKKNNSGQSESKKEDSGEKKELQDDDDDDDSDSGDCSSIQSPCDDGGSPRCGSPVDSLTTEATAAATLQTPTSSGSSRWWRFGSSAGAAEAKKDKEAAKEAKVEEKKEVVEEKKEEKVAQKTPAQVLLEPIPDDQRIPLRLDFQLQTSLTDKSYWSVLKSHFAYWTNMDVTAFLLNQLYPPQTQKEKEETK